MFSSVCLECIEKIATKKQRQRKITCHTCRAVTPLAANSQIRDLPRPLVANDLQELIEKLVNQETKDKSYTCDYCEGRNVTATVHCFGCKENMCNTCYTEHQDASELNTHKTAPICDWIFCASHHEEVTMYCHTCNVGICNRCVRKGHKGHKKEDIGTVAMASRSQARECLNTQKASAVRPDMMQMVQQTIQEIETERDTVVDQLDYILDLVETLEVKVKTMRSEVVDTASVDITALKLYASDLSDSYCIMELGHYLVEKASDPEVVARATSLPSPSTMAPVTSPPTISIPSIDFHEHEQMTKDLFHQAKVNTKKLTLQTKQDKVAVQNPITQLEHYHTYKLGRGISGVLLNQAIPHVMGIVFNPARSQLVAKTTDKAASIKVYDLKGNKLAQFGAGIEGLSGAGCISLDSHRDLYLAACDGHLTTLTMDGQSRDRIDMPDCQLKGIDIRP